MTNHDSNPITKIVYSFHDSSVPPQYHRSYTITLTNDKAQVVVDSYGDILADTATRITGTSFREVADYLQHCGIREIKDQPNSSGCVGGTSETLTVWSDNKIILDGEMRTCGGTTEGTLAGDVESFTKKIENLIPDFEELLK